MKHLVILFALLFPILPSIANAEKKQTVIFEATVVRIDTWGLMKFSCGVMINYRLAEYKVDAVHSGHLTSGENLVAKHMACNWNELDDLKPGDKVLVVAEMLKHPEKSFWQPKFDKNAVDIIHTGKPNSIANVLMKSDPALVQCRAMKVAKLIYPLNPE